MTFLLRAALVIGALSYLALMRGGADPAAEARKLADSGLAGAASGVQTALPAALAAVPPETQRAGRAVMARGLMAELSRRAGADEPASRDTLVDADRLPAWRGAEVR